MPHKKNPILSENLTGLARLIRSNVIPALENVALWHERDVLILLLKGILDLMQQTLDFALARLSNVVKT